jgi:hypothetical protein
MYLNEKQNIDEIERESLELKSNIEKNTQDKIGFLHYQEWKLFQEIDAHKNDKIDRIKKKSPILANTTNFNQLKKQKIDFNLEFEANNNLDYEVNWIGNIVEKKNGQSSIEDLETAHNQVKYYYLNLFRVNFNIYFI